MADRSEAIAAVLRAKGGRMTSSRRVIIDVLLSGDAHLTADAIAEAVQRRHPDIHRSTVYRTLDTLTELGVVTHVHLGHGPSVFHLADEDHHHLVCSK
ncbi:MAG: Fur family transcriptional regulator, partial [Acidimicrobiia bacterium]